MKAKYFLTDRQFITNDNGITKKTKKKFIFDEDSNTYIQYGGVYRINKGRN